jgi:methionyl-tRNA formyltransferase
VKLVFFGTPSFAASILEHIVSTTHHQVVAVVSKPDTRRGRGRHLLPTPVKEVSSRYLPDVPILQPVRASVPSVAEALAALSPDLFIVVAYGEILKPELLNIPRKGCFNIHASLLPAYRGAAPIQRALIDGCRKSGITIIRMSAGLDSGDMVWRGACEIGPDENAGQLQESLLDLARRGIVETLKDLETDAIKFVPQHHEEATLAPKISQKDLELDVNADVVLLHDRIRAFAPDQGAFFWVLFHDEKKRFKVLKTHVDQAKRSDFRKWIVSPDGVLCLSTPEGTLFFDIVQMEGRAMMPSSLFLRGTPLSEVFFL